MADKSIQFFDNKTRADVDLLCVDAGSSRHVLSVSGLVSAPIVTNAEVGNSNSHTIVLTFNQVMNQTVAPDGADFAAANIGGAMIEYTTWSDGVLLVNLSDDVSAGDEPVLTYAPGVIPIQALATDLPVAAFADLTVDNNI